MTDERTFMQRGECLLELLTNALKQLEANSDREGLSLYRTYLHGQIYGMATALRMVYPGPGNLGEKAALAVRPVLTEHFCGCDQENNRQADPGNKC